MDVTSPTTEELARREIQRKIANLTAAVIRSSREAENPDAFAKMTRALVSEAIEVGALYERERQAGETPPSETAPADAPRVDSKAKAKAAAAAL